MTFNYSNEFRFLKYDEIYGENKLDLFKSYGVRARISDFAILLGGKHESHGVNANKVYNNGYWWTDDCSYHAGVDVTVVDFGGFHVFEKVTNRYIGARPCIPYDFIKDECFIIKDSKNTLEVLFGEYPQTVVGKNMSDKLEKGYKMIELRNNDGHENTGLFNMKRTCKQYSALEHKIFSIQRH